MAKKICIFSSHYFPYLGGVESYTYNLAKALMKRGDKVMIVTSNDMGLKTYEVMDGIPVCRVPCFNLLDGRFPVLKFNRLFGKIHKRLMGISFDLVLVNTRYYLHSVYGLRFAKKQGTKCILLDHSTNHMTIGSRMWDTVGGWYEHLITSVEKRYCSDFYGVSSDCCKWLEHFHIRPKGTLYNAVDLKRVEQLLISPVRDFKKEYNLSEETLVITYTGRLLEEKGVLKLIEAANRIDSRYHLCVMIAGDGEVQKAVQKAASQRIIPLGRLSFEEVIALLKQSDIYCLPTGYPEGFPTSVLEAAAVGCYVITTTRGGSKELILDERYGMIMNNNEVDTIQKALESVIDRPEYRKKAARLTKQRLIKNFTWEIISEKVHNLK